MKIEKCKEWDLLLLLLFIIKTAIENKAEQINEKLTTKFKLLEARIDQKIQRAIDHFEFRLCQLLETF